LDIQAPDQEQGLILEREGRIKKRVNSNPTINLDHRLLPTNRSTVGISFTTKQEVSILELKNSFKRRASEDSAIIPDR
jgi:hypothetical protein